MNRQEVFEWVKKEYGTQPDYPWADGNAVLRHADTRKWYGLIMRVGRDKLGLKEPGAVDVLNVKCDTMLIGAYRRQPGFFPAYHMNKQSWLSMLLDGSVPDEDIKTLLDLSYTITAPKRK